MMRKRGVKGYELAERMRWGHPVNVSKRLSGKRAMDAAEVGEICRVMAWDRAEWSAEQRKVELDLAPPEPSDVYEAPAFPATGKAGGGEEEIDRRVRAFIGSELVRLAEAHGQSVETLAIALDVSPKAAMKVLSGRENKGRHGMNRWVIQRSCAQIGIDPEPLLDLYFQRHPEELHWSEVMELWSRAPRKLKKRDQPESFWLTQIVERVAEVPPRSRREVHDKLIAATNRIVEGMVGYDEKKERAS